MHINIKNHEAHKMAKELSYITGESMTESVIKSIEQRLDKVRERSRLEKKSSSSLDDLLKKFDSLPTLDDRDGDEILYDENGLCKPREQI